MSVKVATRQNAKTTFAIIIGSMLVCVCGSVWAQGLVKSVDSIGITVSDVDRSVEFFSKVLNFEKVSDTEVAGAEYEQLVGVFGVRMRPKSMGTPQRKSTRLKSSHVLEN